MRTHINLPHHAESLPFSDAVLMDDTLYLSGCIGIDPATGLAPMDLDQEITLLFDHLRAVLAEAGMTMDDLVQVQVFCPDVSLFEHFNSRYRGCFRGPLPARAFIGSGSLLREGRFEILGIERKS